jgi:cyclopropane fatty-acyl-phospholipid synthase-like methyltransferase
MEQQQQTLQYFKTHASDWQQKAVNQTYSLVENRHNAVFETMKLFPPGSSILDIGCGTGQLAIESSTRGWIAKGIDFSQEMIDICIDNNAKANTNATFECCSIFDYAHTPESLDVISAQGFIEYISLNQLDDFFDFVRSALKKNGAVALGSRNRLFNLHTLNAFTELEDALGTIKNLLIEGQILQSSKTQDDALAALESLRYQYEQPTKHPLTGVAVDTRYQFTPADLITRLSKHNIKAIKIYPVHYHPLPISLMTSNDDAKVIHAQLAKYASLHWINSYQLVPYSSSFVVEAKKT